ncbi:hypothetical protein GNQ40_19670 [Pseudomonas aeruginosa]|nr:hypothetical protein [Pseudomonas aeruginosa]
MSDAFLSSIKNRRTIYALDKQLPISQEKVVELVKEAVSHSPSAFNSQTSRVVVLFGAEHEQFWNIAKDELRIPRSSGHPFHEHLTTDSTVIRPPIPRASGH